MRLNIDNLTGQQLMDIQVFIDTNNHPIKLLKTDGKTQEIKSGADEDYQTQKQTRFDIRVEIDEKKISEKNFIELISKLKIFSESTI